MLEARTPSHLWLRGEEREGSMRGHQETVSNFGTGNCRVVVSFVVEIQVCFRPYNVALFAHGVAVFRRSSKRRCLRSQ
jgi:hypothetical protein